MSEKKDVVKIFDEEQVEVISKYLESRFFQLGVKWHLMKYEEVTGMTYKAIFTQDIPVNVKTLGIFAFALKSCTFCAKVWIDKEDKRPPLVSTSLSYEHNGGGSNGCDLNVRAFVNGTSIVEDYHGF